VRLLLDTHTLLWSFNDAPRLSAAAASALHHPANEKIASAATFWEMAIKYALGKLQMPEPPEEAMLRVERERIATILPIRPEHLRALRTLPRLHEHKDPFDRMLVAQALSEDCTLVSSDPALDAYGVRRLW
jgi:PIN domain nuclease of toxin-antitoxin system